MKNRLKELRQSLGLNQDEFARKLGVGRSTIANYEAGTREPVSSVISLICDRFGVNEQWLRTGEGDMKAQVDKEHELYRLVDNVLKDDSQELKRRLATAILKLTPEQMEAGLNWIKDTFGLVEDPAAADQPNTTAADAKNPVEMTREEAATELNRQYDTVEEGKSTAVQDTASGSFG